MADTLVLVCKTERKSTKKMKLCGLIFTVILLQGFLLDSVTSNTDCPDKGCVEGKCVDGKCECDRGWGGEKCQKCSGRRSLSGSPGTIEDGEGNYTHNTKCSWLIKTDTDAINTTFRLQFHQFATECGWDHLYIHDGDSAFSPLLAAYSGLLATKEEAYTEVDFITHIHQPYIYVHFYSDAAYTMSGFNLTYSIGDCPRGCSGNGTCEDEQCKCYSGWTGEACDVPECPNQCAQNGVCTNGVCICDSGFRGEDCSLTDADEVWGILGTSNPPAGRASHSAILDNDDMWVLGGYALNDNNYHDLLRYNIPQKTWYKESASSSPPPRYGHSTVLYDNKLYMYGGVVNGLPVSETWVYDINFKTWTNLTSSSYKVSGHTAHVYGNTIHVIFGYSPLFGYLNKVQLYDIVTDTWSLAQTTGMTVRGGYGHTSQWDPNSRLVYVHGGYHSGSQSSYNLSDVLYSYDPALMKWSILKGSGYPRYLHSAVIINNFMLVFGGNTHNDTSVSNGAKCYSSDFMMYNIQCDKWYHLDQPDLRRQISRYGQSMVYLESTGTVYMFGGFSGTMRNDMITYMPGDCSKITSKSKCYVAKPGSMCMWENDECRTTSGKECITVGAQVIDCGLYTSCRSCSNTTSNCTWCNNKCVPTSEDCIKNTSCLDPRDFACDHLSTCAACLNNTLCMWDRQTTCSVKQQPDKVEGGTAVAEAKCDPPCSGWKSCKNCTENACMWCSNMQQCVETNSYVASFPYGQCTEWTTKEPNCAATTCAGLRSCMECQAHPLCGWCNDPSNTGLGKCMEGGLDGPINSSDTQHIVRYGQCPREQWYFIDCPKCQCNGHSTCLDNSSVCEECQNRTTGNQCQQCEDGYYGNPKNGGSCDVCKCNGQADTCNHDTGVCYCRTRGVTGDRCDRCDDTHKYYGDPKSGGTCYYQLVTDYQFTFNLSKPDDSYYTQINFMNIPKANDRDVDFTLNCSASALLNITFKSKSHPEEQYIVSMRNCTYFKTRFEHKNYAFAGDENTTFRVYVYNFKTSFWLQISFSQFPKIDLVHFFVTFFSCFLSLLLVAALLWKIKHKYDSYRRRQQMIVEMQQMASRPFAAVTVEMDSRTDAGKKDHKELTDFRKRKRGGAKPATVAIEPLHNTKAAILTVIMQLPTGTEDFTPCGQSGIAMGSTLITFGGNTRKQSVEHIRDRPRLRKHLPNYQPDTSA